MMQSEKDTTSKVGRYTKQKGIKIKGKAKVKLKELEAL